MEHTVATCAHLFAAAHRGSLTRSLMPWSGTEAVHGPQTSAVAATGRWIAIAAGGARREAWGQAGRFRPEGRTP
jgi:hypothetical protein